MKKIFVTYGLVLVVTLIFLALAVDIADKYRLPNRSMVLYETDEESAFVIPPFRTTDLDGNEVRNDVFTGKVNVVCLWVTEDADVSRELLQNLAELNEKTPDQVRFVGLVGDVKETDSAEKATLAAEIAGDCRGKIPQLKVNDDLAELLTRIHNAPMTFFVDENGKLIGYPIVGNEPRFIEREISHLSDGDSLHDRNLNDAQRIVWR